MNKKKSSSGYSEAIVTFFISFFCFYFFVLLQRLVSEISIDSSFLPVYLPAGVFFVVILVGGLAGALGVYLALVSNYILQNPDINWYVIAGIMLFSLSIQIVIVKFCAHAVGVGSNLEGLNHIKVVGLALVFSLSHSVTHHYNLVLITHRSIGWGESKIALSTFFGVFCILMVLWLFSKVRNYLLKRNSWLSP